MDKNTLKELVAQVAEIKERKPLKGSNPKGLGIEIVTEIDPVTGEEVEFTRQIPDVNETLGWEIVKLKEIPKLCELGCGDIVCNQVVERRFAETPKPHWKTRCQNCGCYLTPDGEGFVDNGHAIQALYYKHLIGSKYKSVVKTTSPEDIEITVHEQNQSERKKNWATDEQGNIVFAGNSASMK